jgi:hypothetical protein
MKVKIYHYFQKIIINFEKNKCMELLQLQKKIKQLPPNFQEELFDFADYLLLKYQKEAENSEKKRKIQREFGCMKNLIISISDDFDGPLDDFKDYM